MIEINFIETPQAVTLFENARDSRDILLRLSALTDIPMKKGKPSFSLMKFRNAKEIVTAIKFLVDEGSYRYILSGSLLGVELKDIRSVPVGYMTVFEMFPLNFMEFCRANKISDQVLTHLQNCFENRESIDSMIHTKMMELFRLYLIVGGMPAVVQRYLDTNNLREVYQIQQSILQLYKKDIAKYDPEEKTVSGRYFQSHSQ